MVTILYPMPSPRKKYRQIFPGFPARFSLYQNRKAFTRPHPGNPFFAAVQKTHHLQSQAAFAGTAAKFKKYGGLRIADLFHGDVFPTRSGGDKNAGEHLCSPAYERRSMDFGISRGSLGA
ncbi:MAG TPA: hypothetical protein PKY19_04605 [Oscillospiraceae bacterium]|nr:hypothetical protein [Oscillospiraceae bacterium]